MRDPSGALSRLLHPLTVKEFATTYIQRQAVAIQRQDAAFFDDLPDVDDAVMLATAKRVGTGVVLHPDSGTITAGTPLTVKQLEDAFTRGSVVEVRGIGAAQRMCLAELAHGVERALGLPCHVDVAIAAPHSRTRSTTFTEGTFVLQVDGGQAWRLCPSQGSNACKNVTLHPGSVLYVPRGMYANTTPVATGASSVQVSLRLGAVETCGSFLASWLSAVPATVLDEPHPALDGEGTARRVLLKLLDVVMEEQEQGPLALAFPQWELRTVMNPLDASQQTPLFLLQPVLRRLLTLVLPGRDRDSGAASSSASGTSGATCAQLQQAAAGTGNAAWCQRVFDALNERLDVVEEHLDSIRQATARTLFSGRAALHGSSRSLLTSFAQLDAASEQGHTELPADALCRVVPDAVVGWIQASSLQIRVLLNPTLGAVASAHARRGAEAAEEAPIEVTRPAADLAVLEFLARLSRLRQHRSGNEPPSTVWEQQAPGVFVVGDVASKTSPPTTTAHVRRALTALVRAGAVEWLPSEEAVDRWDELDWRYASASQLGLQSDPSLARGR